MIRGNGIFLLRLVTPSQVEGRRSIVLRSDNLHFDSTLLNGKFLPVFRKIATHNEHIRAGCRWWTRIMEGLVLVIHQNNIWIIFFKIKNKKNKRQIFKEKSNNNDIKRKSSTNRLFLRKFGGYLFLLSLVLFLFFVYILSAFNLFTFFPLSSLSLSLSLQYWFGTMPRAEGCTGCFL